VRILVAGLLAFESGKTEFVLGLVEALLERGFKPGYFKPVAGHDGWYQYETVIHSIERGILVGHDAYVVAEHLNLLDKLYIVSPVDLLTLPIDLEKLNYSVAMYLDHATSIEKRAVLGRLSLVYGPDNYKLAYYVCGDVASKLSDEMKALLSELLEKLKTRNAIFVKTSAKHLIRLLDNPGVYRIVDSYIEYLADRVPLIIESYNDAAAPTPRSLDANLVFIVAPGKALVYDGSRYKSAVELLAFQGKPWSIRTGSVIGILGKPRASFNIPVKTHTYRFRKVFEDVVEFITRYNEAVFKQEVY